ncbi:chemotaxis protein histidine kinase CheA [Streptomyces sp. SAI-208]|uniref:hypothetical protein n=1 Tax=Streptomyces sp. SAI-208 TaxID=2940550 RepID=UPI0024766F08|nr:hypothetical protein [Streptomyces sp. SAI-208]MDH6610279.1 chemotaxis protein histidine kinase CheA [Streptomyces sp. SAI-208]
MTASPPLNGHKRPALPVLGDWRPATPEPDQEQRSPQPEPAIDAEVARARAWAEAEERRVAAEAAKEERLIKAQAEADSIRAKAAEDARKQHLANNRQERKDAEEQAASEARIAESRKRKADADRAREEADRLAAEQQAATEAEVAEVEEAENRWRGYARSFYIVCAIVALPVQVAAFYNPRALWLMAAPLMLEGGAWVVLKGAAAAVAGHRPHWHYRLIAWLLAFIAAGINLWHGLHAFDPATAIGTAFASVAGPGVWDLHEHGRIRKRDGALTRRERKAAEKAAKEDAKQKAAAEARKRAEEEAAKTAAEARRRQLAEERQREFEDVWAEAVKIAAAVGSTTDDDAVWTRAYRNIKGCDPGESIESITARRTAEKRVEAALTGTPVNTLSKTTNAQRAIQTPRSGYKPVPPRRKKGDTPRYSSAAGRAHGELLRAKKTAEKDPS